jgi:transcriptional regulator with XRE-family HTH domain
VSDEGDLFRRCREALGLTQTEMAHRLLIADRRTVRRWEKGDAPVTGPVWLALAAALRHQPGAEALAHEVDRIIAARRVALRRGAA